MWTSLFNQEVQEEIKMQLDLQVAKQKALIVLQANHTIIKLGILDQAIRAIGRTQSVEELYNLIKGAESK